MFLVIDWDTGQILQEHESESKAKRECRKLGYTIYKDGTKAPIAYVSDGQMFGKRHCVYYNPRFKTAPFA